MALKMTLPLLLGLAILIATDHVTANRPIKEASGGGSSSSLIGCWDALLEVKSCSNEILLFFLSGQTDIGPDCCRAIAIITRNCWPAMLSSLGFTAEEGNLLRGYCDAAATSSTAPAASPSYRPYI